MRKLHGIDTTSCEVGGRECARPANRVNAEPLWLQSNDRSIRMFSNRARAPYYFAGGGGAGGPGFLVGSGAPFPMLSASSELFGASGGMTAGGPAGSLPCSQPARVSDARITANESAKRYTGISTGLLKAIG